MGVNWAGFNIILKIRSFIVVKYRGLGKKLIEMLGT